MVSTRANKFHNLTPINVAAYSTPSLVILASVSAWAAIDKKGASGGIEVAAGTLTDFLQVYRFEDADIVKTDIEGAQLAALTQIEGLVARNENLEIIYESATSTCQAFAHDQQMRAARFEELGLKIYAFRGPGLMLLNARDAKPAHLLDILATRGPKKSYAKAGFRSSP